MLFLNISRNPLKHSSHVPILIVIGGATATGKSELALTLAEHLNLGIISADSRQVYREFNIGTAKPSLAEQRRAAHYLIDICEPIETLTVAEYQQRAQRLIATIHRLEGFVPLLVGGTGLYINSVVRGLKIPQVAPQLELRSQLRQLGQVQCYAILQAVDPISAQRIHPNDQLRTLRALEVFYVSGLPISAQQAETPPTYPILYIGLDCQTPDALKQRIEARTEKMMARGLLAEVEKLSCKYGPDLPLLKTLGYAEMLQYLAGDISLVDAQALTVRHTRQFAKRQRTWFRRSPEIVWFDADASDLADQVWRQVQDFLRYAGEARKVEGDGGDGGDGEAGEDAGKERQRRERQGGLGRLGGQSY